MAVVFNKETGLAESLPRANQALQQGTHEVPLVDAEGNFFSAPVDQAQQLLQEGYAQPSPEQVKGLLEHAKFSAPTEQIKSVLHGVAKGALGPLDAILEQDILGRKAEDIRASEETNPGLTTIGEVGGLFVPGGQGRLLGKIGALAGKLAPAGEGLAAGALRGATAQAAEMALLQAGDETSKMLLNDPHQSVQTAISNVGLAALLGGGVGGAVGSVSPLWKATVGDKASKFLEDAKARFNYHKNTPNPVESVSNELSEHYSTMRNMADDVYGASGLKAQDIAKAMPDALNDRILEQSINVGSKLEATLNKMKSEPDLFPQRLTSKLDNDLVRFKSATEKAATPAEHFNATQDLKQSLQSYSKYDKFVKPVDEAYDFVRESKSLASDLRGALEDKAVWGKAAERQQAINKAFVEFKPALEDFEKKFTSEVAGERVIDPGKVNTYMNQLGKPNAELKQEMLKNFLDASEKYRKVISDTHANLGLEAPAFGSTAASSSTVDKIPLGAKFADWIVEKGAAKLGGHGLGASLGATLGHAVGAPGIGAIVGERVAGPFLESVLPAIIKPLMETASNSASLKAAAEYGMAVAKGEKQATQAVKSLFKAGSEVVPLSTMPTAKDAEHVERWMKVAQNSPETLIDSQEHDMGHYLPGHNEAAGQTVATALSVLQGLKPDQAIKAPLDPEPKLSKVAQAKYENARSLVMQPASILNKIRDASITPQDVQLIKTIYPNYYASLGQKITDAVIEQKAQGNTIPYKLRLSLSAFLGAPLDSSISSTSIISNNLNTNIVPQSQEAIAKPSRGLNGAFKELPGMYASSAQANEQNNSVRRTKNA